jgi:K+-transporting ATPase ATPase A chain
MSVELGILQNIAFLGLLTALAWPLGIYMARVYQAEPTFLTPILGGLEKNLYRLARITPDEEMDWKVYSAALLIFSLLSGLFVFLVLRLQGLLPANPQGFAGLPADLSFNTAVSFITNTNWQSYSGEVVLSYLSQMLALGSQNFLSAAVGMAVLVALARAFERRSAHTIGNFWVDLTRGVLYILLPLSILLALLLVSQGVVQTFQSYAVVTPLQPGQTQTIALGPAASQIAVKQLGTNGGGFFGVNSAHPFENPTPFSNLLETLAILLIPAALPFTFGKLIKDTRQGWALYAVMSVLFVLMLLGSTLAELQPNPALNLPGVSQSAGNLEGKETRFGVFSSTLWSTATTAASNGSVNAMLDSYSPLGGLAAMWMIQLGEVVFGGVGSGLYGMLVFVLVAVFVAGLMVGRTPEYLGKKIEPFEMKMAALVILIPPMTVLLGAALAVLVPQAQAAVSNPGAHGFSQILYAFSSAANNNGSAFAGLATNNLFYNLALGIAMLIGRFFLAIPVLAIAGSLVTKKKGEAGAGTLPTHTPLFIGWLVAVVIIVGALSFLPALALGPLAEQLTLFH